MTRAVPKHPMMAGSAAGANSVTGYVTGVDGNVAKVIVPGGNEITVRIDRLRGKSIAPKAGETWILDQPYGSGWMFAVCLGYKGSDEPPEWLAAMLLGSWVNASPLGAWTPGSGLYSPAGFCRDEWNWVSLRGTVTAGTITNDLSTAGPIAADIFRLPAGYRPSVTGQLVFPVASASTAGVGQVLVMPDGYVRATYGDATALSLDGVRFLAAQ